jgi:hypothetical protein
MFSQVSSENNNKTIVKNSKERATGLVSNTTFLKQRLILKQLTTYIAENLPAMKEEAFVNNIDNYTSSISTS